VGLHFSPKFAPPDILTHPASHPKEVVVAFQRLSYMPRTNPEEHYPRNALAFSLGIPLVPRKILMFPSVGSMMNLTNHMYIELGQSLQKLNQKLIQEP
jgi:hypothetical protein